MKHKYCSVVFCTHIFLIVTDSLLLDLLFQVKQFVSSKMYQIFADVGKPISKTVPGRLYGTVLYQFYFTLAMLILFV